MTHRLRACAAVALAMSACALLSIGLPAPAFAHGVAGKRFFPATPTTEDPFVADELSLPIIARRKTAASGDEPATLVTTTAAEFTKRITPNFGLGFGANYLRLRPEGAEPQRGFDNLSASAKYQFYKNDQQEAIMSVGADWDIGGSGAKRVGAESFSTVTPGFFFGKGFGALPDSMKFLRPFALTGVAGIAMPSRSSTTTVNEDGDVTVERHPNVLKLGLALEYSLPYLQSFVKDVGLREPFNRMLPVVELALQKPLDRGGGPTTGTLNPGVLWAGRYVQVGLEATIPVNSATGGKTGVLLQLHFFLDDLFPRSIGKPLFDN
jgi:hypothetical protein